MPQCAVVGCNSTHRKTKGGPIRYHRFPGDSKTRSRWLQACGKQLNNCSTARVCSRHFRDESYERDVQHEILGLPARCRLKKGAVPEKNLPTDFLKEEEVPVSEYDILLAVGLVPTAQPTEMATGGLPEDLNKMQIMEDVREGCNVQPSSPGHADQRSDESQPKPKPTLDAGLEGERDTNEPPEDAKPDFDEKDVVKNGVVGEDLDGSMEIKEEQDATEESSMNAGSPVAESTNKRKSENEDYPVKRLRAEIHENFASRDKILNEFIEMAECNNLEQLQTFSEQLLAEVKTLNDLAKEKEREWNNVIHLKKLKEELLLRMQRKRQLMLMNANDKTDYSDLFLDSEDRSAENLPHSILKANLTSPKSALRIPSVSLNGNSVKQRNVLLKPQRESLELNGSQGKRLTLDVQSIIADYRQRHPEAVPRRGRRIRQSDGSHKYSNSILNFSSMALGSGSQLRQGSDVSNELNVLLNTINMSRQEGAGTRPPPTTADSSVSTSHDSVSFKDMLVQFARLSQSERNELIQNAIKPPPPYPEVTVHPVPTTPTPATPVAPSNSLLHGILTKTPPKQTVKSSFSPTLARLLTAPERAANNPVTSTPTSGSNAAMHPANMSITEILSGSKAHEITITPVETQFEATPIKSRNVEEEETEDSADRLVIDENNEAIDARKQSLGVDNTSEAGEEVPPCQGCNQKAAQFVCAGCGNQWYCSRDCQVSAWDEHSEVCSG